VFLKRQKKLRRRRSLAGPSLAEFLACLFVYFWLCVFVKGYGEGGQFQTETLGAVQQ